MSRPTTTTAAKTPTSRVRVFVSYDIEHDGDLIDLLEEQATAPTSGFEISGRSTSQSATEPHRDKLREAIREVEQVIVICGEHTADAYPVSVELQVAQEEQRPYFLLWGRRQPMCSKPTTAKPGDTMFSWTPEIIAAQLFALRRREDTDEQAAELRRPRS